MLIVSCASDRSASGTTGTEAGNALAVTLSLPDGSPAARAKVVARHAEDVDSSNASEWIEGLADDGGNVLLELGKGDWTLEIHCGRYARVSSMTIASDTILRDTLVGTRSLVGMILGASGDVRLGLPGLGRSVPLAADGTFRFDNLPEQQLRLAIPGLRSWNANPAGAPLLLSAQLSEAVFRDPVRLSLDGDGLATMRFVPDSLVPDSGAVLLDSLGRVLPMVLGGNGSEGHRLWNRVPSGVGHAYLCRSVAGRIPTDSLFSASDGTRLEIVPALSNSLGDLSGAGGEFVSMASPTDDPAWGLALDGSLGSTIGIIRKGLPDTGAFAVSFQAKLLSEGIEALWLLDWRDSTGNGLRVGVGGRQLRLQVGDLDTSIVWDPAVSWFGLAVGWDGSTITVSANGIQRLRIADLPPGWGRQRSSWKNRSVGLGGGMRLGRLTVRHGYHNPDPLSRPAESTGPMSTPWAP